MRATILIGAAVIALMPLQGARACPPPPRGYAQPTHEQLLKRSLSGATDILYGVIVQGAAPGQPARFRIVHVYRGSRRKGDTIEAPVGWGHPTPRVRRNDGCSACQATWRLRRNRFCAPRPPAGLHPGRRRAIDDQTGWIKSARSL